MFASRANSSTSRTSLGRTPGIDVDRRHTQSCRLVLDELRQLVEGPGVEVSPLRLPLSGSPPNPAQALKHDHRFWFLNAIAVL